MDDGSVIDLQRERIAALGHALTISREAGQDSAQRVRDLEQTVKILRDDRDRMLLTVRDLHAVLDVLEARMPIATASARREALRLTVDRLVL